MSPDKLDTLECERHDADRLYNEALTAFDAALFHPIAPAAASLAVDSTPPPPPSGWRARGLRSVRQWLLPWIERQHAFNARTADAIDALISRDRERAAAFGGFQSALIVFLQRINAFIDTKDKLLSAIAERRLDEHDRALQPLLKDTLPELRTQIAVLDRAVAMLKRRIADPLADPAGKKATSRSQAETSTTDPRSGSGDDYKYVGFEDQFRGSDEGVAAKLDTYLPIFAGASDVVDLGCGRGEFLAALEAAGVPARGVDLNDGMVAVARERGLDVTRNDALAYIAALPDASIGGVIATQVIEHMDPSYLLRLLDALSRTLRPQAPIVLETINPACWYAFFSSYLRDLTHVRPVHPETLQYLLRASGFERVEIRYRAPLPDTEKLKVIELSDDFRRSEDPSFAAVIRLADACNANATRLNSLMFSYMDYAVIGYRI